MAKILVTNDDGASSKLWSRLCDALGKRGHEVWGVVPSVDQSWTGVSLTVTRNLTATLIAPQRFAVDGTPADCVAVALAPGGLVGEGVDAVVSGINAGVNTRLPVILSSGTLGAAVAGAFLHSRAIAFSYALKRELAVAAKAQGGVLPEIEETVAAMIAHCAERVERLLGEERVFGRVYNVNFPAEVTPQTQWARAATACCGVKGYFELADAAARVFKPSLKLEMPTPGREDEFAVLGAGKIAEGVLELASL